MRSLGVGSAVVVLALIVGIAVTSRSTVGSAEPEAASSLQADEAVDGSGTSVTGPVASEPATAAPAPSVATPSVPEQAPVDAGTCAVVTYTPPGAVTAQVGELCRPITTTQDTAVVLVHGGGGYSGSYTDMNGWRNTYLANGYVTFAIDYRLTIDGVDDGIYPLPEQNLKAAI